MGIQNDARMLKVLAVKTGNFREAISEECTVLEAVGTEQAVLLACQIRQLLQEGEAALQVLQKKAGSRAKYLEYFSSISQVEGE